MRDKCHASALQLVCTQTTTSRWRCFFKKSPTQVHRRPALDQQPHPHNRVSLPAGLHVGDRLVPRDNPLPTFLPRFPPCARHPTRGLRSRVIQTVVLAMCLCGLIPPTQWQGQKSVAMRRDSPLRLWSPLWTINVALYYFFRNRRVYYSQRE